MRVAVLVNNPARHDGRVRKTALTLADSGHDVTVICRAETLNQQSWTDGNVQYWPVPYQSPMTFAKLQRGTGNESSKGGLEALSAIPRPFALVKKLLGGHLRDAWIHLECLNSMSDAINQTMPEVIHANDLDTLPTAFHVASKTRARIIYDAHEIAVDEYPDIPIGSKLWRIWQERRLMCSVDRFITMSEPAADFFFERYGVQADAVIFNSPSDPVDIACPDIRSVCGLDAHIPLIVFTGYLRPDRGMREILHAVKLLDGVHLAQVGPSREDLDNDLKQMADKLEISERVHSLAPVHPLETAAFIRSADVALIVNKNFSRNVDLALPNKFFDALLANVPLVAGRQTAVRNLVERWNCGVVIDETSSHAIADGIKRVLSSPLDFRSGSANYQMILKEYSWAAQAEKLRKMYVQLERSGAH
jgi:glycosyltransferase involved in cell wall biosynthesis